MTGGKEGYCEGKGGAGHVFLERGRESGEGLGDGERESGLTLRCKEVFLKP